MGEDLVFMGIYAVVSRWYQISSDYLHAWIAFNCEYHAWIIVHNYFLAILILAIIFFKILFIALLYYGNKRKDE